MKKLIHIMLFVLPMLLHSQTTIFNLTGSEVPNDWTATNNVTGNAIAKGSYLLLEAGAQSDELISATYDLSAYSSAELNFQLATYGSGTANNATVEISTDGGNSFTSIGTSNTPSSSSYIDSGAMSITSLSATMVIKLTNSGASGRGVRLKNIILTAFDSNPSVSSTKTEIDGLGYVLGNNSVVVESFNASGINLTDDITISFPQGFEGSLDNTTFSSNNITLDASGGSVSATTIYVKLSDGLTVGNYNDNISITSAGATNVDLPVDGNVFADPFVSNLAQDLFISEYAEGGSSNKYLEIYNPTDQAVDLSNYAIASVSNDPTIVGWHEYFEPFEAGASIASGETYVWANSGSAQTILDQVAISGEEGKAYFNGDDGYALAKGTSESYVILDIIGDFNGDPGDGWSVAGVADATKDKTLVRKSSVTQGNNDFTASAGTTTENSEWIVYDKDTFTYIGTHTFSIFDFGNLSVKVYPNPVQTKLNFSGLTSPVQATVFDMLGKRQLQSEVTNSLDVSQLKSGLYMVEIKNENSAKVFNILKK